MALLRSTSPPAGTSRTHRPRQPPPAPRSRPPARPGTARCAARPLPAWGRGSARRRRASRARLMLPRSAPRTAPPAWREGVRHPRTGGELDHAGLGHLADDVDGHGPSARRRGRSTTPGRGASTRRSTPVPGRGVEGGTGRRAQRLGLGGRARQRHPGPEADRRHQHDEEQPHDGRSRAGQAGTAQGRRHVRKRGPGGIGRRCRPARARSGSPAAVRSSARGWARTGAGPSVPDAPARPARRGQAATDGRTHRPPPRPPPSTSSPTTCPARDRARRRRPHRRRVPAPSRARSSSARTRGDGSGGRRRSGIPAR